MPASRSACHLLAGTAEHQRIAGFQPHDALAGAAQRDQQRVDLGLALGMAALALADRQALGVAAAHGDDRLRHQRIVDDDVGLHQQALGAQREQVFGARTGADQRDWPSQRPVSTAERRRRAAALGGMAGLPSRAPARRRRNRARSGGGQLPLGSSRSAASRNDCASAASAPSDGDSSGSIWARIIWASTGPAPSVPIATADRRAVDDRRREEIAELRPVDGVDGNAGAARVAGDPGVETVIAACRKHHHRAGQVFGTVRLGDVSGLAGGEPGGELDLWLLCDDDQRGAGLAEQLGLGKRFRPVADDDDGRAFYPHKYREGVELGGMLRQVGTPDTKPPF